SSISKEFNAHIYPIISAGKIEIKIEFGNKFFEDFRNHNEENLDNFFKRLVPISETGDGVKSFISLLFALKSPNNKIIIIDEPETFLHPPTARSLGRLIAENSNNKTIIVATHSSEILSGIIERNDSVSVFRSTNIENGIDDFLLTRLDEKDIKQLNTDPMLRAIEIQNCLFYKGSIITEGDSDRIFYSTVMRLLQINNLNIVPAQNVQTIANVIAPLRKLNIPVVGIFDIDILLPSNESEFAYLKSAGISETEVEELIKEIKGYQIEFESRYKSKKNARDELKKKGISIYPSVTIIDKLAKAGLFVVPVGELENWLSPLCLSESDNKKNWVRCIIEEMTRMDKVDVDTNSDVWAFIRSIDFWINNYTKTIIAKRHNSKEDMTVSTPRDNHNKNPLDALKSLFSLDKMSKIDQ
ncbi:MAG: AAA family ATPase, partial [Candidatus Nitrosocosmicus sp.]|nr:AAA family ATPase [Candidatus Nitrosocosmicus sp.]